MFSIIDYFEIKDIAIHTHICAMFNTFFHVLIALDIMICGWKNGLTILYESSC